MAAPSPQSVIIACPNCGTRYQLRRETLGKKRMVKCAHCQTAWEALPEPDAAPGQQAGAPEEDRLFTPAEEKKLDAEIEALEREEADANAPIPLPEIASAIAPRPKPGPAPDKAALARMRQRAFAGRLSRLNRKLPIARLRKAARQIALAGLIVVFAAALLLRTEIVRQFPDLAGAYEAIGLGVNVIGLEFQNVRTLKSLREGTEVLIVNARIASVSDRTAMVHPVVVTLLDGEGRSIYEWSVTPQARELEPGEGIDVETQLLRPPAQAQGVRLSFTVAHAQGDASSVTAIME